MNKEKSFNPLRGNYEINIHSEISTIRFCISIKLNTFDIVKKRLSAMNEVTTVEKEKS